MTARHRAVDPQVRHDAVSRPSPASEPVVQSPQMLHRQVSASLGLLGMFIAMTAKWACTKPGL